VVKSLLSDTHHEMVLEMEVNIDSFQIEKINVQVLRAPFELCFGETDRMQQLVGIRVNKKGIYKEVQKLLGGIKGCTHLVDLTMEGVNAIIQAGFRLQGRSLSVNEKNIMFKENFGLELKKACHTYDKLIEE